MHLLLVFTLVTLVLEERLPRAGFYWKHIMLMIRE
jgi:hypothetical protein